MKRIFLNLALLILIASCSSKIKPMDESNDTSDSAVYQLCDDASSKQVIITISEKDDRYSGFIQGYEKSEDQKIFYKSNLEDIELTDSTISFSTTKYEILDEKGATINEEKVNSMILPMTLVYESSFRGTIDGDKMVINRHSLVADSWADIFTLCK